MANSQTTFDFNLPSAMSGQDFIVSDSNREAVEWIGNAGDWPAPALIVYGAPSSGKSHLCQIWQELYQATEITQDTLRDEAKLLELLQPEGYFYVDNVDRAIEAGAGEQEGVFHLYNVLFNQGGRVLLTASKAPKDIGFSLKDLSSRLLAAPSVEIQDPDDQTLEALLVKLFDDRQILIKPDVIKFLLPRLERSYDGVRQMVKGLDAFSLQGKRPVTIPLVRQWLSQEE